MAGTAELGRRRLPWHLRPQWSVTPSGNITCIDDAGQRTVPESFAEVYARNVDGVYGFFGYRVRTREAAEDLTQLTFERALRAWPQYDPARALARTWLFSIARNLLTDHRRADRSSSQRELDDDLSDTLPGTTGVPVPGLAAELEVALGTLSHRDREIVALRFGADLPSAEIAALMGMNVPAVQQVLSRCLRKMRVLLDEDSAEQRPGDQRDASET